MRICVIGTGYVGLVVGVCLSESGNDVICADKDEEKISRLSSCKPTTYEPGLTHYLERNLRERRLCFSTDIRSAVKGRELVFVAVGTPPGPGGQVDMSSVWDATKTIGETIGQYTVVVLKSTVPVGTAKRVREIISSLTDKEFSVVSNPEFLKEGAAIADFMKPDRVIVGLEPEDTRAREIMRELYEPFLRTGKPFLEMSQTSAEVCKYACNSMLATRISFMNQLANFCNAAGADVNEVRKGMGVDPRIGPQFLFPGVGFGGSCFPKDLSALIAAGSELGVEMDLLDAVREVNNRQKRLIVGRVKKHFGENLSGKKGAVWGLSFKPRTDDMREAPSILIIEGLLAAGAELAVFDPVAMEAARGILGDRVGYAERDYEALRGANFLVVVTEWNEFRRPDFRRMKESMQEPVIFDGRNIYSRAYMERLGFVYYGIGC